MGVTGAVGGHYGGTALEGATAATLPLLNSRRQLLKSVLER